MIEGNYIVLDEEGNEVIGEVIKDKMFVGGFKVCYGNSIWCIKLKRKDIKMRVVATYFGIDGFDDTVKIYELENGEYIRRVPRGFHGKITKEQFIEFTQRLKDTYNDESN